MSGVVPTYSRLGWHVVGRTSMEPVGGTWDGTPPSSPTDLLRALDFGETPLLATSAGDDFSGITILVFKRVATEGKTRYNLPAPAGEALTHAILLRKGAEDLDLPIYFTSFLAALKWLAELAPALNLFG